MAVDLYEHYKDALRSGHIAVLRGRLDDAVQAYALAAELAPGRPLPHTGLGGVYLRQGRVAEALAEFAAAVARGPRDEGALLGQAEALAAADRRVEAAASLDRVAQIQATTDRLPEAADTLRRALELHEAPERVRRQRALIREIRLSAGDLAAEQLLARALRIREEPSPPDAGPQAAANPSSVPPEPTHEAPAGLVAVMAAQDDGAVPATQDLGPSIERLLLEAEEAEAAGDQALLRERLLAAAGACLNEGRHSAGLDMAQRLVQLRPSDVDAHLLLVELYAAERWDGLAAEKLLLLGRLADLDDDEATRQRLCAAAARAFPTDERLLALCSQETP